MIQVIVSIAAHDWTPSAKTLEIVFTRGMKTVQLSLPSCFSLYRFIRLTSPNLNYMIVLGTLSLNLSVYMNVYPPISTEVLAVYCIVS